MLLKIITGEKPVDYFDEFVTEWNKTERNHLLLAMNRIGSIPSISRTALIGPS